MEKVLEPVLLRCAFEQCSGCLFVRRPMRRLPRRAGTAAAGETGRSACSQGVPQARREQPQRGVGGAPGLRRIRWLGESADWGIPMGRSPCEGGRANVDGAPAADRCRRSGEKRHGGQPTGRSTWQPRRTSMAPQQQTVPGGAGSGEERHTAAYRRIFFATTPATSVRRKSRPL